MNNKKLLAILGSPNPSGTIATMLNYAVNSAEKTGYEVIKINLYQKQIAYCKGCRRCLHTSSCVQQDDMGEIASLLQECAGVILAAPVYWANVPAPVKNLFDRSLGIAMEETKALPKPRLPGKKYMLLTACKTPFPFAWLFGQSRGAIRNMDEFFKTAGMKCKGKFVCANASHQNQLSKSLIKKLETCWE